MILPASPFVVPQPNAPAVTFQVIAPLPALSESEMASTEVLAQVMSRQTQDFSPGRVLYILSGAGDAIHWDVTSDHLRFSFTVPKADETLGFTLFESFLQRPALTEENIKLAEASLSRRRLTPWQLVLAPVCSDPAKVRSAEILRMYRTLIRPEKLVVAIGGDVDQVMIQNEYSVRVASWHPDRAPRAYAPFLPKWKAASPATIVELPGHDNPSVSPADVLAIFALGCGKGASIFRIWRETNGWSYLQAAGVRGGSGGLALDSWFATNPDSAATELKDASTSLTKDVDAWTDADRSRALAMAESVLLHDLAFGMFWFDSTGPLRDTLEDRTFLAAYWKLRTGSDWDPRALLDQMKLVSLEDLRKAAAAYLEGTSPRVLGA